MAVFSLGYVEMVGFQPQFTFVGAQDPGGFDPRSGTVWSILGPSVTFEGSFGTETVPETYWYAYGAGFDVNIAALPTEGVITSLYQVVPIDGSPPPALEEDLFVDRVFASVTGLNISAADFAAAVTADTVTDLLLAGDDLFRSPFFFPGFYLPVSMRAGAGNDTVYGSGFKDQIFGDSGDDLIVLPDVGGPLRVGQGSTVDGGTGDDTLTGGMLLDLLFGGQGTDRLDGGRGDDTLNGGSGRDRVLGGDGTDLVIAIARDSRAGEVLDGGAGTDTLALFANAGRTNDLTDISVTGFEIWQVSGNLRVSFGQVQGLQRLEFGGIITMTFAASGFIDLPTAGQWVTTSALAQLTVQAGSGRDIINGRDLGDVGTAPAGLFAYGANDSINAGAGQDVVNGGSGHDSLRGEAGNDVLNGEGGSDVLTGDAGADTLNGDGGNDWLAGGAGSDVLNGGAGEDRFVFAAFADSPRSSVDLVQDFVRGDDLIDLSGVVADSLIFNGQSGFVAGGKASMYVAIVGLETVIRVDDGGGGEAEMVIRLTGIVDLTAGDLVL